MKDFVNDYGFHIQLLLVGTCWAFMVMYVYEKIKDKNNKK